MVRGVKKQVIEVLNTENEFFERAILVVSEQYADWEKGRLDRKAKEYIGSVTPANVDEVKPENYRNDRVRLLLSAIKYCFFTMLGGALVYFFLR